MNDLNGNLLSETTGSAVKSYTWDRENRLRAVAPPTGTPTTYDYDANGLRVRRVDGTGTVNYLLDGPSVLEELDATGATSYLNNPQVIDEVLAYQKSGAVEYPLTDALGSIYAVTDSNGAVAHRYEFDVYGVRADLGGSASPIDVGYTGRWHDANGLIEHRDRQRNPMTANWLQPDPAGHWASTNAYWAFAGNPASLSDPSGGIPTLVFYSRSISDDGILKTTIEDGPQRTSFERLLKKELVAKRFFPTSGLNLSSDTTATEIDMVPIDNMEDLLVYESDVDAGPTKNYARIAFFGHGSPRKMQFGWPGFAIDATIIARLIRANSSSSLRKISLLGCDTAGTASKTAAIKEDLTADFGGVAVDTVIGTWVMDYQPFPSGRPEFTSVTLNLALSAGN